MDLRVLAWSMPGYGQSAPLEALTFQALSAALSQFLAALGLARVHLVGQSIGGMIALDHALRRPGEVASLTLIGTTPAFGGRDDSFKDAFLKARLAPLEAGQTMAQMAAEAAPRLVGQAAPPEVIAAVARPLAATTEAVLAISDHIQIAGVPGRHEPDNGEINYPFLFDHIDRIGYTGWIGCEYRPAAKTEDGLGWARQYL